MSLEFLPILKLLQLLPANAKNPLPVFSGILGLSNRPTVTHNCWIVSNFSSSSDLSSLRRLIPIYLETSNGHQKIRSVYSHSLNTHCGYSFKTWCLLPPLLPEAIAATIQKFPVFSLIKIWFLVHSIGINEKPNAASSGSAAPSFRIFWRVCLARPQKLAVDIPKTCYWWGMKICTFSVPPEKFC